MSIAPRRGADCAGMPRPARGLGRPSVATENRPRRLPLETADRPKRLDLRVWIGLAPALLEHTKSVWAQLVGKASVRGVGTTRDFGSLDVKRAVVDPARIGLGTGGKASRCKGQESQTDERAHDRVRLRRGDRRAAARAAYATNCLSRRNGNRIRKKQQPAGSAGGLLRFRQGKEHTHSRSVRVEKADLPRR
jgi:hypothetical protein